MKKLFFAITCLVWTQQASAQNNRPFLSAQAAQTIKEATIVQLTETARMKSLPLIQRVIPGDRVFPGDPYFHKTLTPAQSEKLRSAILSASDIDPKTRLSTCQYEPGVRIDFRSNAPTSRPPFESDLTLLLCFNCDVWAIGQQGGAIENVVAFGDSKPQRKELMELVEEVLGKDFFQKPIAPLFIQP